jgi:DNA-binding transcriptional regulator YiaG
MRDARSSAEVVELRSRTGYRPDLGALAREQIAQAREALGLSPDEFADMLAPLLGWEPTGETVISWETTAVPPGDVMVAASLATHSLSIAPRERSMDIIDQLITERFSDVTAVYTTRSEFMTHMPPHALLDGAMDVRAAGLSLNLLCQHYADRRLRQLIENGTRLRCLFLDPGGEAIQRREIEEGYPAGKLSALNEMNIQSLLRRVHDRLPVNLQDQLEIRTYDETIRFNIILLDSDTCIAQPYLPESRGVDSPTLVIKRRWPTTGLYPIFDQIFNALWERGRQL